MVKKISDLYLETRRSLLDTEDQQTASLIARNIVCKFTGKSQEQILADRDKYVTEETCQAVEDAVSVEEPKEKGCGYSFGDVATGHLNSLVPINRPQKPLMIVKWLSYH